MLLEAQSANCFSSRYVLKLDERPIGQFRGRWFREGIDIRLTERLQMRFEKQSWLGSQFQLIDTNTQETLADGSRAGFFTGTWNLNLRSGPAQLVRVSLFSSAYEVKLGERIAARATRIDWCSRGWRVQDYDSDGSLLDATDLVFVGLIYHTILQRQRSQQAGS